MNGTRSHNAVLKVSMAQYGRERASSRSGDGVYYRGNTQGVDSEKGAHKMSYRQALTGEKMSSNIRSDCVYSQDALKAVEEIKARVVALELEVARLQNALRCDTSIEKVKIVSVAEVSALEGQQMEGVSGEVEGIASSISEGLQTEVVPGGDGDLASFVGDVVTHARKDIVIDGDKEKLPMRETAASVRTSDCLSEVVSGSISGEMGTSGSGKGSIEGSKFEAFNEAAARSDWVFKEAGQSMAFIIADVYNNGGKGYVDSSLYVGSRKQMEEETGGEGENASSSDDDRSGMMDVIRSKFIETPDIASELSYAREETALFEAAGGDRDCAAVTPKKLDKGEAVVSYSGDEWPAGSGGDSDREKEETGESNVINSRGVWDSKKDDPLAAVSEFEEGLIDGRCVVGLNGGDINGKKLTCLGQNVFGDGLNSFDMGHLYDCPLKRPSEDITLDISDISREVELIRGGKPSGIREIEFTGVRENVFSGGSKDLKVLYGRSFKDQILEDALEDEDALDWEALEEMDFYRKHFESIPVSVGEAVDMSIRKRSRGKKKKKRKSKRRNFALFRWLGVKRGFPFVYPMRILSMV